MVLSAGWRACRDFEAWLETEQRPGVCAECLGALLQGRAAYLGAKDPTRWRRGDVRALLYDLAVPRLSEQCDLTAHTVPTVDAYLEFLDRTERLHPGSVAVRYLREELAHRGAQFPAAMADRSRFRMAKTLYEAMLHDGTDIDDDEAVDAWIARFNQAPQAERAAVLEYLLAGQPELLTAEFAARAGKVIALPPGQGRFDSRGLLPASHRVPDELPVFEPVHVPSQAEAAAAARGSELLADLLTVARRLGRGCKVTKTGEPVPAEVRALAEQLDDGPPGKRISRLGQAPGVQVLFWLARQLELVDLRRTELVAGPALATWQADDALATADDAQLLDLWREVFTLIEVGQVVPEEAATGKHAESMAIYSAAGGCTPAMLVSLYRKAAADEGERAHELVSGHLEHILGPSPLPLLEEDEPEIVVASLQIALCLPLDQLIAHGALHLSGPGADEQLTAPRCTRGGVSRRAAALASGDRLQVRLTPLGRWAMRETLRAEGADAPAAAERP